MSNSTRPGGYDERLVVPLEASRRGAHRARVNPLLSVLPLLAVVVVVVAVVGLAYTLFVKGSNGSDDNGTASAPTTTAPAATQPTPSVSASAGSSSSARPSASASTSAPATAKVDKTASFTIYNGSTPAVSGLGARAQTALLGDGWTGAKLNRTIPATRLTTSHVYYAKDSQKATAEAIAKAIGVGSAKLDPSV